MNDWILIPTVIVQIATLIAVSMTLGVLLNKRWNK